MQQRNIPQLKKLWTNLKHSHPDILTREKQNRFATGGGPKMPSTEVDPEVAAIAPMLRTTAPIIFTSNMLGHEVEDARENLNEYDSGNFMNTLTDNYVDNNDIVMVEENNPSTSQGTHI